MLRPPRGTPGGSRVKKAIILDYLTAKRGGERPAAPRLALTTNLCDGLPVEQFEYEVRDTELRNLSVRVRPTGSRVLYVTKKIDGRNARSRVSGVGELPFKRPRGWTGDTVHSRARALLAEMEGGKTASVKRLAKKAAAAKAEQYKATVKEACDYYIELKDRAPNTQAAYKRFRDRQLAVHWPDKLICEVSPDDVIALHSKITSGEGRGFGPVAANNLVRFFRAVWRANRRRLILGECPTVVFTVEGGQEVTWHAEKRRSRYVRRNELADWWQAVQGLRAPSQYLAKGEGGGDLMADYLEFCLLTGLRRREITTLSRKRSAANRIDERNKDLVIMENKSNHAGARDDRTHRLPITAHMQTILDRREGLQPFPIGDPKKAIAWVQKRSGVNATSHDLRRTFLSHATAIGVPMSVAKDLVNHSRSGDVTEGYVQIDDATRRDYLERIQSHLLSLAGSGYKVVQLAGRRG